MSRREDDEPAGAITRLRSEPEDGSRALVPVEPFVDPARERRRRRLVGVLAAALLFAGGGVAGWWYLVRTPPLTGLAFGNGRIEATEIDVATRLAGRVEDVLVEEGDTIRAGATVARIDVEPLEAQLAEATAALEQATEGHRAAAAALERQESVRRLAEKEFERARRLFESNVASEDVLDTRRMELETAEASVDQAKRQFDQAERAIEAAAARADRLRIVIRDATLVAPRGVRVLYRLAEPGEVLPVGGRVITLIEEGDAYMTVFLPENQAAQVQLGAEARIHLDGFPGRQWPASVSYVAPEAQFTPKQVETRSEREKLVFKVKVQLPTPVDPVVKSGMRGVAYVRLDPDAEWPDPPR
ncbi:MAG: HlyD family secretion protein [Myxococcota bacterium]